MNNMERELLYRLLTFNTGLHGYKETIRVGELPPDFPFVLPAEAAVLGSLEQRYPVRPVVGQGMQMVRRNHCRVMLDATLPPTEFLARLREQLPALWQDFPWPPHQMGGFLDSVRQEHLNLYNPELELTLHVEAVTVGGKTQAALNLHSQSTADMERMLVHRQRHENQFTLRVPEGVTVYPDGSSGGSGQWNFTATLETDLSASDLLNGFSQELATQGWAEQTRNVTGSAASANWTGDSGVVLMTLRPMESGFMAQMMVSQSGDTQSNTGSSSFSF